jgi:hypothetical protein
MLELALLKPTTAELDRRKRSLNFVTGYETYQLPYEHMELVDICARNTSSPPSSSNPPSVMNNKYITFSGGAWNYLTLGCNGDSISVSFKNYSHSYLVTSNTTFQYYSQYTVTFYWLATSTWDGSKYVIQLNDSNLLGINGGLSPTNCGTILKNNDYQAMILATNETPGRDVNMKIWSFFTLPPYLRGDMITRRWDSADFEALGLEAPPGFPRNPVIPRSYQTTPALQPERT